MPSSNDQSRKSSEDGSFNFDATSEALLKDSYKTSSEESLLPKSVFAQCLVTGAVMLSAASCGMPIGYSAILLPQLKSINGTLQIDDNIGSWIASVHSAATPLGSLLSGILMERCGRKLALQISAIPLVIGWLLIGLAQNHTMLLAGRLIAGTASGLTAAPGQVLIGEISEPHVRGIFTSVPFASYSFGILLVYALGSVLNWRLVAGLSTLLPLLAAAVFFLLPESPVWLVRRGRDEDARQALIWLRGGNLIQILPEQFNAYIMKLAVSVVFLCLGISLAERLKIHTQSSPSTKHYSFFPLRTNYLEFNVNTTEYVSVVLSAEYGLYPPYYEIVFDSVIGNSNFIRKTQSMTNFLAEYKGDNVRKNEFQKIWISFNDTEESISAGKIKGRPLLYFQDENYMKMSYFGISAGFGGIGAWDFDFKMLVPDNI